MASQLPIVVIGGGTAGCTVVSTLAAMTSQPIVLVEPGVSSSHDDESKFFDVLANGELSRDVQTTVVERWAMESWSRRTALGRRRQSYGHCGICDLS